MFVWVTDPMPVTPDRKNQNLLDSTEFLIDAEGQAFLRLELRENNNDWIAADSQFELMARSHLETALRGEASEKNRPIPAYPDLPGETGDSDAWVISAFWAARLLFSQKTVQGTSLND